MRGRVPRVDPPRVALAMGAEDDFYFTSLDEEPAALEIAGAFSFFLRGKHNT